jgi:hypothetical protein
LRWNVLVNSTRKYVFCFQLHIAAANGYLSVVEFLLEHSVRKDVRDKDDWQPSHAAACWGHVMTVVENCSFCICEFAAGSSGVVGASRGRPQRQEQTRRDPRR